MPFYSGSRGSMYIYGRSQPAAKVQNWSFSSSMNVLETTSLGDTDRTLVAGTRQLSGSCRLFYYTFAQGSGTQNDASDLIGRIIKQGTPTLTDQDGTAEESDLVLFKLHLNDGTANGRSLEFYAFITGASMSMAVGEVLSADISFEVSGTAKEVTF